MDLDEEMKLPAIREAGALAEYVETPGSELRGFLVFLRSELLKAIEIYREETTEALEDGDPFERIQVVNRLRLRKNKLEAHLVKECREVKELTRAMVGSADKSVIDALQNETRSVYNEISAGLKELIQEFGVE
ncbi:hypothetical protein ABS71_04950 [bacterium SCN 62-11]|nr:hypothetical protein [Candidatus Eremiobacteraeota bacterium]ODT75033.1 MAG: hypothetical protein ABS71_04950 [bacterium SCN 62-11]